MGARFRLPEGLDKLLRSELERAIYEAALNESDTIIATRYIVEKVAQIDIAAELGWTRSTVSAHIPHILRRCELAAVRMKLRQESNRIKRTRHSALTGGMPFLLFKNYE